MASETSFDITLRPLPWRGPGGGTRISMYPVLVQQFFALILSDDPAHDYLRRAYIPALTKYMMAPNVESPLVIPAVRKHFADLRKIVTIALDEQPGYPCWAFVHTNELLEDGSSKLWDHVTAPTLLFTADADDAFAAVPSRNSQVAVLAKAFEAVCHAFAHLLLQYVLSPPVLRAGTGEGDVVCEHAFGANFNLVQCKLSFGPWSVLTPVFSCKGRARLGRQVHSAASRVARAPCPSSQAHPAH
jgi:hypothetical protein